MPACEIMPRIRGKACMQACRNYRAVFSPPRTLIRAVTFGVDTTLPSPFLKAVKKLPTLPKVWIFAWRLGHDCLPIGSRVLASGLGFGTLSLLAFPLQFWIGWSRLLDPCLARALPSSCSFCGISGTDEIFGFMTLGCSQPVLSSPTWSPPSLRMVAIYVDGAFVRDSAAGIGVVARDSSSKVLGGLA
ncbi:hypothetical protein V6N12_048599 [Hibiscus sabdariffa]|uniref:Reverse transcriptase zinc-binding domain-containing protein n=1 Tax=Hibiscus sabdariffa TaxID=183260 RepID=A0ABR2EHQ8_9ROSI